ncbi:MAG: hypothetical protein K2P78_09165 [Gemmataceae bacterium]|nr:hypothetical protein [Gemmataceae bacterium]
MNQQAQAPVDPWVVSIKSKKADIPFGQYTAVFLGVEDCDIVKDNVKEPRWRWRFKIATGPLAGTEVDDITDRKLTGGNKPSRYVVGFKGGPLVNGDNMKAIVDGAVGKAWLVKWGQGTQKGIGIQDVSANLM